jgi:sugar phosphate isomerase/epimerase
MSLPVLLSTASAYPENCAYAFDLAERLGYDGVEVMVWTDPVTQEAGALRALSELHAMPVRAIHAPTLLLSQRIWGWSPWGKIDRSLELAADVGADTVVVHPPFRWQREYAAGFVHGVEQREDHSGIALAVENMFPWRAAASEMQAYLPHWDPLEQTYRNVTLDVSHAATGQVDSVQLAQALGDRLAHVHLADSLGSFKDEHLVPGRGTQPCEELLRWLLDHDYDGAVTIEVGTRKLDNARREVALAEALDFAREHLGQDRVRG